MLHSDEYDQPYLWLETQQHHQPEKDYLASVDLEKEGEPLVVETEGESNIKVGDNVKIGFKADRCHLFDSSKQAFK